MGGALADKTNRLWFRPAAFTMALMALVTVAVFNEFSYETVLMMALNFVILGCFFVLFPGSHFFVLVLANQLAVYAVAFSLLTSANFRYVSEWTFMIGFPLPLLGFLFGSLRHRQEIKEIIAAAETTRTWPKRRQSWLLWLAIIGALTFIEPGDHIQAWEQNAIFLAEVGLIALIVFLLSRSVCAFIGHVGLVFSDFFSRTVRLVVPAVAFLTMYSLNIIVFACIYQIFDRLTVEALFNVGGEHRALDFSESIHFSVITLSTVGYGDISPLADSVRVLASVQIVLGVLLGLFGFAEIMRYARDPVASGKGTGGE